MKISQTNANTAPILNAKPENVRKDASPVEPDKVVAAAESKVAKELAVANTVKATEASPGLIKLGGLLIQWD